MTRNGGQILVDNLVIQGVRAISCVPGESYLPVLDALHDVPEINLIVCRHEAAAGNMAEAYGKLTGRVGVAAVTRGPGATHAAIAVHTADQDATPMILLVGQVASRKRRRGGFQEIDSSQVFGSMAKWVVSLDSIERIPETIARAVRIAESGRPGPVVIDMPEDVLSQLADIEDARPAAPMQPAPDDTVVATIENALAKAERPLILLGRGGWDAATAVALELFASANDLPVVAGFRCQDFIDNDSPQYIGHLGLSSDAMLRGRLEGADLILAVGGHFGDPETKGYELLADGRDDRTVIHVSKDPLDVDRYIQADVAIQSSALLFLNAVSRVRAEPSRWAAWRAEARAEEDARSTPSDPTDLLGAIMSSLRERLPRDAVLCNGAGNYAVWLHQFSKYREFGTQLAPASGAMGYGLPAGLMAKALHPERTVVVFAGDGCFMMSSQELATAKAFRLNVIVVVVNNNMFGTIRLHQEKSFPGRVSGTDLVNPDFAVYAQSFGISGRTVTTIEEFDEAFTRAQSGDEPALIEVLTDPDRSTPGSTLTKVRAGARG